MNQPKIVHLVAGELNGGAARGAYWLHRGLLSSGARSLILTSSSVTLGEPEIISINNDENHSLIKHYKSEEARLLSRYPNKAEGLFSSGFGGLDLTSNDFIRDADIVHLHWVNGSFFDFQGLNAIGKPIVWTLRDMWPMTGGCHYSFECRRFENDCGCCPLLGSDKKEDLSSKVQRRKSALFPADINFVGISHWIAQQAKASKLLGDKAISIIHNCIDCSAFFPVEQSLAREILGLKTSKRVLLIGATRLKDPYKGFNLLKNVLSHLNKEHFYLLFFGASSENDIRDLGFEYKRLGYLYDNISMRVVYSAADVFLCTSIIEAFGKTVAEAMACGTPAISFDNSGPAEIIKHKTTGYIAKSFDVSDFVQGVYYICDENNQSRLKRKSVERARETFDKDVIAERYLRLYFSLMKGHRK